MPKRPETVKLTKALTEPVSKSVLDDLESLARRKIAPEAERLFLKPTKHWAEKPEYQTSVTRLRSGVRVVLTHSSQLYHWLDEGTKRRIIYPRRRAALRFLSPYRPSTRPGSLTSRPAFRGTDEVFARAVRSHHPPYWIRPRGFSKLASATLLDKLPKLLAGFVKKYGREVKVSR